MGLPNSEELLTPLRTGDDSRLDTLDERHRSKLWRWDCCCCVGGVGLRGLCLGCLGVLGFGVVGFGVVGLLCWGLWPFLSDDNAVAVVGDGVGAEGEGLDEVEAPSTPLLLSVLALVTGGLGAVFCRIDPGSSEDLEGSGGVLPKC